MITRLARKALRESWAWLRAARPGASAFGWNVLHAVARDGRACRPASQTPAEYARWVDWPRLVAQIQRHSVPSHPENGFCACGIPVADLERFRDQIELIAWEMQQQERGRGQ